MTKIIEFESDPGLDALQQAVGGYIERVPYFNTYKGRDCDVVCDEEGKLVGKDFNHAATAAWWEAAPIMRGQDHLVGDIAVIYGGLK